MNLCLPTAGGLDQPTAGGPGVVDLPTAGGHDIQVHKDVDIEFIRMLKRSMKRETNRRVKAKKAAKKANDVAMISEEEKKQTPHPDGARDFSQRITQETNGRCSCVIRARRI